MRRLLEYLNVLRLCEPVAMHNSIDYNINVTTRSLLVVRTFSDQYIKRDFSINFLQYYCFHLHPLKLSTKDTVVVELRQY